MSLPIERLSRYLDRNREVVSQGQRFRLPCNRNQAVDIIRGWLGCVVSPLEGLDGMLRGWNRSSSGQSLVLILEPLYAAQEVSFYNGASFHLCALEGKSEQVGCIEV